MKWITASWLALTIASSPGDGGGKFYPDDPLRVDDDRVDVPEQPAEVELSQIYDVVAHVFADLGSEVRGEAENVNTLDEVPDSSWFTNRIGVREMSPAEIKRGPDSGDGPDPDSIWTIFRSKVQGLTPGFQIEDEKGDRYLIKFGPRINPELATAAEVIATKIFYALGYYVPENYIVYMRPENLRIRPGTKMTDRFGDEMDLSREIVDRLLERVPRESDGSVRVLASKYVEGVPIGPFRYFATRSDDPNDVIDHEQRRELRGLRLFAAWTNHDDTRAHNTLGSYVEENGKHHVRHYLIDFGSTFGSASVDVQPEYLGFHYFIDPILIKTNIRTFGIHVPTYHKVDWPQFPQYSAVGRFEAEWFDCASWRNEYPNPAFVRLTERDAFWAAKLMMRFSREQLEAIVESGQYSRQYEADYFLKTLIGRQRNCGKWGINLVNPLGEFRIEAGELRFKNLSRHYGFSPEASYEARWRAYDDSDGSSRSIAGPVSTGETSLEIPAADFSGLEEPYLAVDIRTLGNGFAHHELPVSVYLRRDSGGWLIVGIERQTAELVEPMTGNP